MKDDPEVNGGGGMDTSSVRMADDSDGAVAKALRTMGSTAEWTRTMKVWLSARGRACPGCSASLASSRLVRLVSTAAASALSAMVVMTAIECFQLTMIPAHMLASEYLMTRLCARLMGVEFSFLDLLAYGVGIGCIYLVDSSQRKVKKNSPFDPRGR